MRMRRDEMRTMFPCYSSSFLECTKSKLTF